MSTSSPSPAAADDAYRSLPATAHRGQDQRAHLAAEATQAGVPQCLMKPENRNALADISGGAHSLSRVDLYGITRTAYVDDNRQVAIIPDRSPVDNMGRATTTFLLATRNHHGEFEVQERLQIRTIKGVTKAFTIDEEGKPKHKLPVNLAGLAVEHETFSWLPAARPNMVVRIRPEALNGGVTTVRQVTITTNHGEGLNSTQPAFLKAVQVGTMKERHFHAGVRISEEQLHRNTTAPAFTRSLAIAREELPGVGEQGKNYTYSLDAKAAGKSLETLCQGSEGRQPPLADMCTHFLAVDRTMKQINRCDGPEPGTTVPVAPGARIAYTDLSPDNVFIDPQGRAVIIDKDALWKEGHSAFPQVLAKAPFADLTGVHLLMSAYPEDSARVWANVDRFHQTQLAMTILDSVTPPYLRTRVQPTVETDTDLAKHENRIKHIDNVRRVLKCPQGKGSAMDQLLTLVTESVNPQFEDRPTPNAFTQRLRMIQDVAREEMRSGVKN